MKREFFLKALGDIEDDLVCEAIVENKRNKANAENKARILPWRQIAAAAAVFVLASGVWVATRGMNRIPFAPEKNLAEDFVEDLAPAEADTALDLNGIEGDSSDVYFSQGGDSGYELSVTAIPFFFCENGTWRDAVQSYPDGLPAAATIVSDYLTAAASDVRCIALAVETDGERDTVADGLVHHTPGIRTAAVTLTGDPGEDTLRGMVVTVGDLTATQYVRVTLSDGTPLSIDGAAPDAGFDVRAMRD